MRERSAGDRIHVAGIERRERARKVFGPRRDWSKPFVVRGHSSKIKVHGIRTRRALGPPRLGNDELRVKRVGEAGDDFILHVEKVRHRFVETVHPEMIAVLSVDELDVDPHSASTR